MSAQSKEPDFSPCAGDFRGDARKSAAELESREKKNCICPGTPGNKCRECEKVE